MEVLRSGAELEVCWLHAGKPVLFPGHGSSVRARTASFSESTSGWWTVLGRLVPGASCSCKRSKWWRIRISLLLFWCLGMCLQNLHKIFHSQGQNWDDFESWGGSQSKEESHEQRVMRCFAKWGVTPVRQEWSFVCDRCFVCGCSSNFSSQENLEGLFILKAWALPLRFWQETWVRPEYSHCSWALVIWPRLLITRAWLLTTPWEHGVNALTKAIWASKTAGPGPPQTGTFQHGHASLRLLFSAEHHLWRKS